MKNWSWTGYFNKWLVDNLENFPLEEARKIIHSYRFSAFWLRSKCSICSYQLNIWYGDHVSPSILNLFLLGDEVKELAPALSWVGLVLQYH